MVEHRAPTGVDLKDTSGRCAVGLRPILDPDAGSRRAHNPTETTKKRSRTQAGRVDRPRSFRDDLPEKSAFFNSATGEGYDGRIFMNGEENAPTGRALGNVVENGTTYELPALGKAGWDNLLANPATGDKTTVVGQSDGGTQNVYVYSGTKQATGNEVETAGLTNGTTQSIFVPSLPVEDGAAPTPNGPQPFTLAANGTKFDRPEDGAWDTTNKNVYYFATTAAFDKHNRLWRAEFKDAANSQLGGTIEKVLECWKRFGRSNAPKQIVVFQEELQHGAAAHALASAACQQSM